MLVVIGILIALYINNQSEQRKEQERFDMVLVDVEKELIDEISMTREVIKRLAFIDSLYLGFFVDSVEFNNKFDYNFMIGEIGGRKTNKNNVFQRLTELKNLKTEQESILNELDGLYSAEIYVDQVYNELYEAVKTSQQRLRKYDWYESFVTEQFDDDRMIDYFVNDPEYRKMALDVFKWNHGYNNQLSLFDRLAVPVYKKVQKYLDSLNISRSDSLSLKYDLSHFKHYLGKYAQKWSRTRTGYITDSVVISIENDELYWKDYVSGEIDWNTKIIPINKYRFRLERYNGTGHLDFDDQGEVESLRYVMRPSAIAWWKKVR